MVKLSLHRILFHFLQLLYSVFFLAFELSVVHAIIFLRVIYLSKLLKNEPKIISFDFKRASDFQIPFIECLVLLTYQNSHMSKYVQSCPYFFASNKIFSDSIMKTFNSETLKCRPKRQAENPPSLVICIQTSQQRKCTFATSTYLFCTISIT